MTEEESGQEYKERPNKTKQKREIARRSAMIEKMSGLSDKELSRLGMSSDIIEALGRARAIKPSGARKRQLKYCVKLLQGWDLSEVALYLNDQRSQQIALNQHFHHLEKWRDRLVDEGDNLIAEALSEWPSLDRQRLRQLIRDAQQERDRGKPAGAGRKLFRYLRALNEEKP